MTRKEPMTATEAHDNILSMRQETPRSAMVKLINMALGPLGNLTDEAKSIYRAERDRIQP